MNDQLAHEINPLLDIFLTADETVSAGLLTELIDERVEPLVKALIRGKLHVSLQLGDERQINQDARDLVSEVKTRVVAKLTNLKSDDDRRPIKNLNAKWPYFPHERLIKHARKQKSTAIFSCLMLKNSHTNAIL